MSMSDELNKRYKIDSNIVGAIELFFMHGLPPGSCTEHLLRGNFDRAKLSAHYMIREENKQFSWQDHIDYIKCEVPIDCLYERFDKWKGYTSLSKDEQEAINLVLTVRHGPMGAYRWTKFITLQQESRNLSAENS